MSRVCGASTFSRTKMLSKHVAEIPKFPASDSAKRRVAQLNAFLQCWDGCGAHSLRGAMDKAGIADLQSLVSMALLYPVDDAEPVEIDASLYGSHDDIIVEKVDWQGSYATLFDGMGDARAARAYYDEDADTLKKARRKSDSFTISLRIYRHRCAAPDAVTAMFLPGVPVNKEEFTSVAWMLAHQCNVVLVDPLGQGRSSVPQDPVVVAAGGGGDPHDLGRAGGAEA